MIAERLAALREAATPGPWFLHFREDDQWGPMAEWISENGLSEEDAALIVALVNAAPHIEALVRAAEDHRRNGHGRFVCSTCDALEALEKAL